MDGSEPDTSSSKYTEPFISKNGSKINARAFNSGVAVGTTSRLEFPIHLGSKGSVKYHTPFLDYKDAAGKHALVDYNYATLTVSDDNWQGFDGDMDVVLEFSEQQHISSVQLTNLRYTISGVYIPVSHKVFGSLDGIEYFLMGEIDLSTESNTQGRNKITSIIPFETQKVISLRVVSKSLKSIPKGHHLSGKASRIYVDEIVVY